VAEGAGGAGEIREMLLWGLFEDGLGLERRLGLSESRASGSTMDVIRVRARDKSRDLRGEELGPGAGRSWRTLDVIGFSARSIRFSPFSRSLKEQHCG
jgi:hypothetical protein